MSYVDLMGGTRWTEADHVERVEADLRGKVTHVREHVMLRRCIGLSFFMFGQMLPETVLLPNGTSAKAMFQQYGQLPTPEALAELAHQAQAYIAADVLAAQARADGALLNAALDYEDARRDLAALPPVPGEGEDPDAERRAALQAVLDAAAAETLELVALRDAARAPTEEPPVEPPPEEPAP